MVEVLVNLEADVDTCDWVSYFLLCLLTLDVQSVAYLK